MPTRCPTLIVRHPAGKEYWAEQEIGDTLFPHDPQVRIEPTQYRGVLLVYTRLDPDQAYKLARQYTYTAINRIIPATRCATLDKAAQAILDTLEECPPTVKLDIHIRGQAKQEITEDTIRHYINITGRKTDRKTKPTLHIETIGELIITSCTEE